jgi:predicted aconitase
MNLSAEEEALRAGEYGEAAQWAIEHQIKVGDYLGAHDFVPVTQAHIMADTESLGPAGVEWLERLARLPAQARRVRGDLNRLRLVDQAYQAQHPFQMHIPLLRIAAKGRIVRYFFARPTAARVLLDAVDARPMGRLNFK